MDNGSHYTARIATSLAELETWGPAYEEFLKGVGDYGIFYQKGWLKSLWPAYSQKPGSLFFIGVWKGRTLLALAPFQRLQKGLMQGRKRLLVFFGTNHPTLVNPWPEIVIHSGASRAECLTTVTRTLAERRDWDEIDINHWREDSPNRPLLEKTWTEANTFIYPNRSAQVVLGDGGYDEYLASLSGNLRNQLRRFRRRLDATDRAEFHCSNHLSEDRWTAISRMHFQRQERLVKQGKDRYSIFGNEIESKSLLSALKWAEQAGCARHYWLDIDGRPAAFCFGLFTGETYFYYFIGMDKPAEPFSGGMLLLNHLIEQEAALGTRSIDLLQGMNRLKDRLGNQQRVLYQCFHQNEKLLSVARNSWVDVMKKITGKNPPVKPEDYLRYG